MEITQEEISKEKKILSKTHNLVQKRINELSNTINVELEDIKEFKKLSWKDINPEERVDVARIREISSTMESFTDKKIDYFKKLKSIENKPYFASIVFKDEEENTVYNIYMSLTYLKDNKGNNILYDWRSPICSLFYDYEIGPAKYSAPGGEIKGELKRKRQYKIENNILKGVFDNSLNIDDEFLQSVLAEESSDHMKNVVNTIQKEQNQVIRNLDDNNLIVNGIAGSGKTTVALHRIAFLLYRLKNITSNNILIFSPNNIFTDYIEDVLPSLGEKNTKQTTFDDYLSYQLDEFNEIESYTDFISRYYKREETNIELVRYKQSDTIINDLNKFLDNYVSNAKFEKSITEGIKNKVSVEDLNNYLNNRYDKFPLFNRIDSISEKLSETFYKGSHKKKDTFKKLLTKSSNFVKPISEIFTMFFTSNYSKINTTEILNKDKISYDNALIYSYIKGYLEGFPYENNIYQVVIDEAQDYNYLQYIIISKIFKKADFTILGDLNQNINPYYKYNDLNKISNLLSGTTKYIELNKTYRSSKEIVEYTNKILNLEHVSAIRKDTNKPVVVKKELDLKTSLTKDLYNLTNEYNKVAIITKDEKEALKLYNLLENTIDISLVELDTKKYNKNLIIIPAYLAKGLEFDAVIVYNDRENTYHKNERNLLYVACTRAQHELYIYN